MLMWAEAEHEYKYELKLKKELFGNVNLLSNGQITNTATKIY